MATILKSALFSGASMALVSLAVATPAYGQQQSPVDAEQSQPSDDSPAAPADATSQQAGEIVVTAQRRSERLQDVPIAMTAVNPQTATELGLRNLRDIQLAMPGTDLAAATGFTMLFIRGIGVPFTTPGLEPPVAIYLDGAYLPRAGGLNSLLDMVDPGQIEVLRGPQGTLYGRNATGGVILLNSANPTDKFEGRVMAEYGRFDHKQIDGMLNVPLSDTLSVRVAGRLRKEDGYVTNFDGTKLGQQNNYTARVRARWAPTDNFEVTGGVEWQRSRAFEFIDQLGSGAPTCYVCQTTGQTTSEFYEAGENAPTPYYNRLFKADLRARLSLGSVDISSLTTYFNNISVQRADNDFTQAPVFFFNVLRNGGKAFAQEFQLTSNFDGPFSFIAGANYLRDKPHLDIQLDGSAYDFSVAATGAYPASFNSLTTDSVSAFLEGTYEITDQVKVIAGGRYTHDKRRISVTNGPGFQLFGAPASYTRSASFDAFTPRFVLAWDNGPVNIYYSFTRAFKAGGFSSAAPFPGTPVDPEKMFNHEVGMKTSSFGGRLRTALSIFYYKNKGLQTQILDATGSGTVTQNAGATEGYGAEFEINGDPMPGLQLGASLGYLHAEYVDYQNASQVCFDPTGTSNPTAPGATLYACSVDLSGTRVPRAPKITASLNARYSFDIGGWEASLAGIAQYRSRFLFWPGAGGQLGYDQQKGYTVANISGYVSPPGTGLRLGLYADNVLGTKYTMIRTTSQPYGQYFSAAKPTTYGVRVEYSF